MSKIPDPKKMKRVKRPVISKNELREAKVRITTYLDEDIIKVLRELAEDSGSKYQTILNQILRDYFFGKREGLVARLERLEQKIL